MEKSQTKSQTKKHLCNDLENHNSEKFWIIIINYMNKKNLSKSLFQTEKSLQRKVAFQPIHKANKYFQFVATLPNFFFPTRT